MSVCVCARALIYVMAWIIAWSIFGSPQNMVYKSSLAGWLVIVHKKWPIQIVGDEMIPDRMPSGLLSEFANWKITIVWYIQN